MASRQKPQVRIRLSPEEQTSFTKLATDAGMDLSEWISDRLSLLADDDQATASKIAEMVVAIWRINEVAHGHEIGLQDALAPKALHLIAYVLTSAVEDHKNADLKRHAERMDQLVKNYSSLRTSDIVMIGKTLRQEFKL